MHLIDGKPNGHLAWGEGELPLGEYLEALGRNGYGQFITFELFGDGSYAFDPRQALDRCFAAVGRELTAAN